MNVKIIHDFNDSIYRKSTLKNRRRRKNQIAVGMYREKHEKLKNLDDKKKKVKIRYYSAQSQG